MTQLCTYWEGDPVTGKCTEPAVVKQGLRCPNGCWGEGEFDYSCENHRHIMDRMGPWMCDGCEDADLILFPPQEVRQ
jgi:hypothetical protein